MPGNASIAKKSEDKSCERSMSADIDEIRHLSALLEMHHAMIGSAQHYSADRRLAARSDGQG